MPVVETTHGRLEGARRGAHLVFRGIPFARPPLGPLRFKAPRPPSPWAGTRPALEFGPAAMQAGNRPRGMAAEGAMSEDCLYLNVYTPALDGEPRPVLVWIHGGAFTLGSASQAIYDGARLVERGDVVVVTTNYRLGAFGYLPLSPHGGDAWGATCNAGQLDQIAALRWVQDNIAAFGGDPGQVTVFGESAGSAAITALLAMPAARGLFHRAICQSGARPRPPSAEQRADVGAKLLDAAGLTAGQSERLQALGADELMALQRQVSSLLGSFGPVVDGATLPGAPADAAAAGTAMDVPLLLGTNRDELNLFLLPLLPRLDEPLEDAAAIALLARQLASGAGDDRAGAMLAAYRASREALGLPAGNRWLLAAIQGDLAFRIPTIRTADAQRRSNTYMYLFEHESRARRGLLRACHALEIPFVFGTLDAPFQDRFAGAGEAVQQLSTAMMDAWLAFARGADPATDQLPWPRYDAERRSTMVLDSSGCHSVDGPLDAEREAHAGTPLPERFSDPASAVGL